MAMNVKQKDKEQVEYLRELVHDINESLERYGSDIPEKQEGLINGKHHQARRRTAFL